MIAFGTARRNKNNRGYEYIYVTPGLRRKQMQPYDGEVVLKLEIEVVEDGRKARRKGAKRGKRGGGGNC